MIVILARQILSKCSKIWKTTMLQISTSFNGDKKKLKKKRKKRSPLGSNHQNIYRTSWLLWKIFLVPNPPLASLLIDRFFSSLSLSFLSVLDSTSIAKWLKIARRNWKEKVQLKRCSYLLIQHIFML